MSTFQNTRICALFCVTIFLLLVQIAISPKSVRADGDTIHLKNGGFVTGQVMEVIPDQYATIRLADQTVRKIEWTEIDRVEMAPEPPPEPPPAQVPKQQPETTPAPVEPITPLPAVQYEERKRSGIPGLYIAGFIVLGVSWVLTVAICPAVSRANDPDDNEDDSRYDSDDPEPEGIDILASLLPVVGPWIGLVSEESRVPQELWVLSGATQGIGIAMAIAGLSLERTQRVPIYKNAQSNGIKAAYLTPALMDSGGAGLSLKVIHY
jgi:hypothetical protein